MIDPQIAYFTMEVAVDPAMPTYSRCITAARTTMCESCDIRSR